MFFLFGLVGGYLAWQRWGPLAGIIGFVVAGGVGWAILNMAQAAVRFALNPRMYRQSGVFIRAWEARFGEIRPGEPHSQPPPGMFKAWYREWRQSGISADDWLDARR